MQTPAPSSPSLFHRVSVIVAVALSTLLVAVCVVLLCIMPGCSPAQAKPILRQVDEHVQLACEGLAQALAERSGADASRIIATSCAIEAITRGMREYLLSQQIEAAKRAGVAVPNVNSSVLELRDPYDSNEAAAE